MIATELRAMKSGSAYWTDSPFGHAYWSQVFGEERPAALVMRTHEVSTAPPGSTRIDGPLVEVVALPSLQSRDGLAKEMARALKTLWRAAGRREPAVLRVPGIVSSLLLPCLLLRRQHFAVQVVGDPLDVAMAARVGGRLAPVVAAVMGTTTWLACRQGSAVLYVTDRYLQRRYPGGRGKPTFAASNVELDFAAKLPEFPKKDADGAAHLVTVAALAQPYKRVDLLIEAVARLRGQGWEVKATVIGGGRGEDSLRSLASSLGVSEHVVFLGAIPERERLRRIVATADVFVLCSDTEGMPRALIEAMHDGVACVGTDVGGIPELLPTYALASAGSADSIAAAVLRHLLSPDLAERNRMHCLARSREFAPEALQSRRRAFLRTIVDGEA